MTSGSGQSRDFSVSVTREIRWIYEGRLPEHVLQWFASEQTPAEHRTDWYDLRSAANGIGRKRRNGTSFDTKFKLEGIEDVPLPVAFNGVVEDWIKISEHVELAVGAIAEPVPVTKRLRTRLFHVDGSDVDGCEVELAEIATRDSLAWSLCFETFGDPEQRSEAFHIGVNRLLTESPLPEGFEFNSVDCSSYPEWLSRNAERD